MTFIMLLLLVWFNELRDAPSLFFDTPAEGPDYVRGCLMTAAVLVAAIVTIGNTYLQEHRVLNSLISVCSNCHRVLINHVTWQKMEDYISDTSMLSFTHGLCPECKEQILKTIRDRCDAKLNDSDQESKR